MKRHLKLILLYCSVKWTLPLSVHRDDAEHSARSEPALFTLTSVDFSVDGRLKINFICQDSVLRK